MLLPFKSFACKLDLGETPQDGFENNFSLQPDKWRADAKVDTNSKAEVPSLAASDIEIIGIGKALRVAVGRTKYGVHKVTFVNQLTFDFSIFNCGTIGDLHRVIVTKHFFNCRCKQDRLGL